MQLQAAEPRKRGRPQKEKQTLAERKKMGRPPKEKKGAMLWIPAECIEFVKIYLETEKRKLVTNGET
jgi:hypothetical protein